MRWRRGRRSQHIEDRRGTGMGRTPRRGLKIGGGMGIVFLLIAVFLGADPVQMLSVIGGGQTQSVPAGGGNAPNDEQAQFVSAVLADTEDTWSALFRSAGREYLAPTLVLYTDLTQTACGFGSAAAGPFYCPGDRKVYMDLSFFRELDRLGANGDFARAYVIGHEVAHHVQNLLGTMHDVNRVRGSASERDANALSVMLELQADCYAGVWAHHAHTQRNILERGDIEEGIGAAAAVGDDRLQRMSGRGVHPETFTHGTSEQRVRWFRNGLQTGDLAACDTFRRSAGR